VALQLFDEKAEPSLAARGQVLIDERRAVKLALAWDAEGPVGALAALSELAPDLSKLSYKPFHLASLAAATLRGQSTFEVKNASVKAAVNLIENCEEK